MQNESSMHFGGKTHPGESVRGTMHVTGWLGAPQGRNCGNFPSPATGTWPGNRVQPAQNRTQSTQSPFSPVRAALRRVSPQETDRFRHPPVWCPLGARRAHDTYDTDGPYTTWLESARKGAADMTAAPGGAGADRGTKCQDPPLHMDACPSLGFAARLGFIHRHRASDRSACGRSAVAPSISR